GEAEGLVQADHGGLCVGSDLAGGSAESAGGLKGVSALKGLAAATAAAEVDVELSGQGASGDLGLELSDDGGLSDTAAAVGAGLGQGRVEGLIDLGGIRRGAMAVASVGGSG